MKIKFKQGKKKKTKDVNVTFSGIPPVLIFIIYIAALAGFYYWQHPGLNPTSAGFYGFVVPALAVLWFILVILRDDAGQHAKTTLGVWTNAAKAVGIGTLVIALGALVAFVVTLPVFHATTYADRINVETVDFSSDTIAEVDFNKTPILDRKSTVKLGDKVMGDMPELVSQFEVSSEYTQISYKNSVYRVTPLEYAGLIKYFNNASEGIPAYILVNSTNGETKLVKLKDLGLSGMKYVPSAYFNHNLQRKLQTDYPTTQFGSPSFEIDEDGHPWYVCTTYSYYGVGNKKFVNGMVLFDPITGDSTRYAVGNFPEWVDRVWPESLVMNEIDDNGYYSGGFLNSIFGQKNVSITSDGYNYLEKDGDIWIYSGVTSVNNDTSNLGFVLSNLRTHETLKFSCSGANEEAAMDSAEGEVKNYGYDATFPLLVNVSGNPVYLLSLKDSGGLVKMYAMVDAKDYQKVVVYSADSYKNLSKLKKLYLSSLSGDETDGADLTEANITIKNLTLLNVESKSKIFLTDEEGKKYKLEVNSGNEDTAAFLSEGDSVHISYVAMDDVSVIKDITVKKGE